MNKICFLNIFFKTIFLFTFIKKNRRNIAVHFNTFSKYVKYCAIYILTVGSYSKIT